MNARRLSRLLSRRIARYCLITAITAPLAFAQLSQPAFAANADETQAVFNIPAEPLLKALLQLGEQANVQIILPNHVVDGRTTQELKGTLRVSDALNRLLRGSGLSYQTTADNTIIVAPTITREQTSSSQPYRVAEAPHRSTDVNDTAPDTTASDSTSRDNGDATDSLAEVEITGTHIRGQAPIGTELITITRDDIERSGYTTIGDVLRSVPQNFAGTFTPATTGYNTTPVGASNFSGASAPDLRGLGAASTLTLVDGRRFASGYGSGSIDISSIPLAAIERVEIIPDGASAIYGSDAVAGVVNIILKRSYQGILTGVTYGAAPQGGGRTRDVTAMAGTDWSTGNIVASYEHRDQLPVEASQRDFTSTAPLPYYLLPGTSANAYLLSAHQEITEHVSAFAQANYFSRNQDNFGTYTISPVTIKIHSPSQQYGFSAGLDFSLGREWTSTIAGTWGKQVDQEDEGTANSATPFKLTPVAPISYQGTVQTAEWSANGPLFSIGQQTLRAALGAGYRHEALLTNVPNNAGYHDREVPYGFSELSFPLVSPSERIGIRRLDLSVSGRYEHYSDFGSEAVPKIGLRYSPLKGLDINASWGKSFHAPELPQLYNKTTLSIIKLADPNAAAGTSAVEYLGGGNPTLDAQTARSWSSGFTYHPGNIESLTVSSTYFHIDYSNVVSTLGNSQYALTYAANKPFVQYAPPLDQVEQLANQYGIYANNTGAPFDPSTIAAIVDGRNVNIAQQVVSGVDSSIDSHINIGSNKFNGFINTTYIHKAQTPVPTEAEQTLSGAAFNIPRFRARGGIAWARGPWSSSAIANFTSAEQDIYVTGDPKIGSWTTIDASVAFAPNLAGFANGFRFTASVQNLFNRDPPYVPSSTYTKGLYYDPLNATPLGRFFLVGVSKSWLTKEK